MGRNLAIFLAQITLFFFLLQQFSYMFACFVENVPVSV